MIERLITMYLAPTIILLIMCGLIAYDKIIVRREQKKAKEEEGAKDLLQAVIDELKVLPPNASFRKIRLTVNEAAVNNIPEDILHRAIDVFGGKSEAANWLTSDIPALSNVTPVDVLSTDKPNLDPGDQNRYKIN